VTVPLKEVRDRSETILGKIAVSLNGQSEQYRKALAVLQGDSDDPGALHELLRIAYNFGAVVFPLIALFVSICDLKPLGAIVCALKSTLSGLTCPQGHYGSGLRGLRERRRNDQGRIHLSWVRLLARSDSLKRCRAPRRRRDGRDREVQSGFFSFCGSSFLGGGACCFGLASGAGRCACC